MRKYLVTVMLSALSIATAVANGDNDVKQTLTVDNQPVNRIVSEIRFDANNAILTFTDGTTMEADMQQVSLQLTYNEATGIGQLHLGAANGRTIIYDLQGRQLTEGQQPKGVYIINGKKINYQGK